MFSYVFLIVFSYDVPIILQTICYHFLMFSPIRPWDSLSHWGGGGGGGRWQGSVVSFFVRFRVYFCFVFGFGEVGRLGRLVSWEG